MMLWCFFLPPGMSRSLNFCARPIETGVAMSPHKKVTRVKRYIENTGPVLISLHLFCTEKSVSRIPKSWDDISVIVQVTVDCCSINIYIRVLFVESRDPFRSRQQ